MTTQQVLVRLPEELARRLRSRVPVRQRSAFVQALLEQALPPDEGEDDPLHQAALAVEQDERLAAEIRKTSRAVLLKVDSLNLGDPYSALPAAPRRAATSHQPCRPCSGIRSARASSAS